LLFSGDELTGLIDLGALREDAVSVDLARLLESCVGQDQARWSAAVAGYRQSAPLTPDQEALAVALIQSGSAAGLETWLRWLLIDKRAFEDTERVRARLTELLLGATIGRGALERGVSAPDQVR
jgi:Ser/Thr protein kinase RdoA (MazF antagonist)